MKLPGAQNRRKMLQAPGRIYKSLVIIQFNVNVKKDRTKAERSEQSWFKCLPKEKSADMNE